MKYSILLQIGVIVSAISLAQGQNWLSIFYTLRKCKKIHDVEEDIQGCLLRMTLPEDKKSYCAIACFIKDMGLMNNDFSLHEYETQTLLEKINQPIDIYMIRNCNTRVISSMKSITDNLENDEDENECQATEILLRCLHELKIFYEKDNNFYSYSDSDSYSDSYEYSRK